LQHPGIDTEASEDALEDPPALHVTPADEQGRDKVAGPARAVQEATGESVELAYADQAYTGADPDADAAGCGVRWRS